MGRKLVVCCDGTWNRPRTNTNIFRTYNFIRAAIGSPDEQADDGKGWAVCEGQTVDGTPVVAFYDQGVGTGMFQRLVGGGLGKGLSQNVCDAYQFLSQRYEPGDEIYIFGFSRGAFTARSLCGLISRTDGLLRRADAGQVERAYARYYATPERIIATPEGDTSQSAWQTVRRWFGANGDHDLDLLPRHRDVTIRFVGVYDTVGALGIPLPSAARFNEPIVGFHDACLGSRIEHAVQVLAVDERRGPYRPTIWQLPTGTGALAAGQSCLQVWFPGVHSDVGGGYPDKGIGNHALDFMLRRATERGLVIDRERPLPRLAIGDMPAQHDSWSGFWEGLGGKVSSFSYERPLGHVQRDERGERPAEAAGLEMLHPCLVERLGRKVKVRREIGGREIEAEVDYAPPGLRWPAADIRAGRADLPVFRERNEVRLHDGAAARLGPKPCRIVDRSRVGARVSLDGTPPVGTLTALDGRQCRVVWAATGAAGLQLTA